MKTGLIILLILDVIRPSLPEILFPQERFGIENIHNGTRSFPSDKAKGRAQWEVTLPDQNERLQDEDSSKVHPEGKPPDGFHKGFPPTETRFDETRSSESSERAFKSADALDDDEKVYILGSQKEGKGKTTFANNLSDGENSTGRMDLNSQIKKWKSYEGKVSNVTNGIHIQNSKSNDENSTKTKVTDIKMNSPFKDFDSNSIFLRKENNKKLKILNFLREIPTPDLPEPLAVVSAPDEKAECVENVLQDFTVFDDIVTTDVLSERDEAERLTELLKESEFGLDGMTEPLMSTLKKHTKIASISVTVLKISTKYKRSVTIYRKDNEMFIDKQSLISTGVGNDKKASWTAVLLNCLVRAWIFGYTFAVEKEDERLETTVYFSADNINSTVDQCKSSFRQILNGGPKCDETTTKCESMPNSGFHIGGYKCVCRNGFYFPDNYSTNSQYFKGYEIENAFEKGNFTHFKCLPCPESCTGSCDVNGICIYQRNNLLKNFILSIQIFCILMTFLLIVLIFKHRKCKTIAIGMWTVMEMILLGSIILYSTVVVRAFEPNSMSCLIEPWFREIGFVLCYGAIILKLYRILVEFRTRKAHRWVIRDKDLLKYLLGMIIVVLGYMSAWTANNLYLIQRENYSMLTSGVTLDGAHFNACKPVWWDYVTQTGEILILIFGIHLSYASRNATTQFRERCFLCISISVEAFFSGIFYLLRYFSWHSSIHPDLSYVAYFIRCQLTTTVVIILLFAPKWWYQKIYNSKSKVSRNYLSQESSRVALEAFKLQDELSTPNNEVEGEFTLADLTPDEIRSELKRLYTQLEVLKNKTIRMNNPHISKRRGGRKIAHRRFSLQKKGSKEKASRQLSERLSMKHSEAEITEVGQSGTPEDSICSNEGPSIIVNDGPSDIVQMTPKKGQK